MKTEIEKYLKENRLMLDADQPDDERIWSRISNEIKNDNQYQSGWFWKIATVFLLGVLISYVVLKETSKEQLVIVTLSDFSKESGQREAELKLIVDKKWEEITPLSEDEKSQFRFLFDELHELDKVYKTYEKDLSEIGGNEQIVNALLDYYEKKLKILNRLSLEIQKQKINENAVTL
jgi:hypothetical protein